MAPDLNSLPPSPYRNHHSRTLSAPRRTSEAVPSHVAPLPPSSPHLSSLGSRDHPPSMNSASSVSSVDNTGVGIGPGPLRHPRPLTAADLHMQLEKEQEAVVNRLTRELSLLRQQSASVVSTTSSTSTGLADVGDQNASTSMSRSNSIHPTPSRRHRSSSSLSARNASTAATAGTGNTGTSASTVGTSSGIVGSTTSGIAPPRETTAPYYQNRDPLSRQSSVASRRSEASSPSLTSSHHQGDHFPNFPSHRNSSSISQSQHPSLSQQSPNQTGTRSSHISSTARYEEVAHWRSELDNVKRENEALRRRIRELERNLSSRGESGAGFTRSDSVSTNASLPPAVGRGRPDSDEDAVHVGESAGSAGVGEGR